MNLSNNFERIAAVVETLSIQRNPALTSYDLAKMLFKLDFFEKSKSPQSDYDSILETILSLHLLSPTAATNSFLLFGRASSPPAEIACSIDPFAYVSHLSAMEHHGLTDRFPNTLYMTRPSIKVWKQQSEERMRKDLNEELEQYVSMNLPTLKRPKLEKIGKTPLHFEERSHLGAFRHVSDTSLRVATIGRVFLDMIREPELCGGIQHVLDVYKKEARRYLKFIADEIDQHGKPIDKVRAGYLLEEVCGLQSPMFEKWEIFAQRGGSRKLDSAEEYAPQHSERWKLSINVPSLLQDSHLDDT
ncbi:type IV toxin-antitoxin system AbiEi family antitoxin domain-containing protein [Undibacterium amnicola]|uniref:type IV toxin-antitoxin system AbiEi family antitoxin domain-containing protein n=1 Tax=Undibacterium amnicola TaxID=1834038 RepID=UPI001C9A4432|nr:hypothetical protein [Undibacterium amnicola]